MDRGRGVWRGSGLMSRDLQHEGPSGLLPPLRPVHRKSLPEERAMPFQGTRVPATGRSAEAGWRSQAACGEHSPDLFFPAAEAPAGLVRVQEATAKAVCRSCPVAGVCLSTALAQRWSHGVRGGLSAEDRRAVLASRTAAASPPPVPATALTAKRGRSRRRRTRVNDVVRRGTHVGSASAAVSDTAPVGVSA